MIVKEPLIRYLSMKMECEYLSDIRFLSAGFKLKLATIIEDIEAREEDRRDRNDALEYLTGIKGEISATEAKETLLKALRKDN